MDVHTFWDCLAVLFLWFQKVHISGLRKGANNNEEIWISSYKYKRTALRQRY